jgi:hypothetical protein
MLLLRIVRGPLRRVFHSLKLQLHRGLLLILLQRVLSSIPQKKAPIKTSFRKAYTVSLPKGSSSQASSSVPPSNMPY